MVNSELLQKSKVPPESPRKPPNHGGSRVWWLSTWTLAPRFQAVCDLEQDT